MDRSTSTKTKQRRLLVAILLSSTLTGCVATPTPVPTVWDKLGITGGAARVRDSLVNRSGDFPGLEKKPPLLKISDPANLAEGKPKAIQAAAKIKQDQDLKKQKLKALKFLSEVNCGCHNKDDSVSKAFLEALGDCDAEVRAAAANAIANTAGDCSKCRTGCEVTCCSEEIVKKLQELSQGVDDSGCPKESDPVVRNAAAAALKKCPCPPPKPIEEIPTPQEIEEIIAVEKAGPIATTGPAKPNDKIVSGSLAGTIILDRKDSEGKITQSVLGSENLVEVDVTELTQASSGRHFVKMNLPSVFHLVQGQPLIVVDQQGDYQVLHVVKTTGNALVASMHHQPIVHCEKASKLKLGLLDEQTAKEIHVANAKPIVPAGSIVRPNSALAGTSTNMPVVPPQTVNNLFPIKDARISGTAIASESKEKASKLDATSKATAAKSEDSSPPAVLSNTVLSNTDRKPEVYSNRLAKPISVPDLAKSPKSDIAATSLPTSGARKDSGLVKASFRDASESANRSTTKPAEIVKPSQASTEPPRRTQDEINLSVPKKKPAPKNLPERKIDPNA